MKLSLYYPVKPLSISQKFGEIANLDYYKANGINFMGHNGIDMVARHGQPIYAAHDGIAWYEVDDQQGHGVILVTNQQFEYKETQAFYKSIYWHMVDSSKEPQYRSPVESYTNILQSGLPIKAGDLLGYADSTGLSTGDHLHFGLKPMALGYANDFTNIEQNNGYMGAMDASPYFNGLYAQDVNTPNPKHTFSTDLELGDSGDEVVELQKRLRQLGYFPKAQECTGFYGLVTKSSVFSFQKDHVKNLSFMARYFYKGMYCYKQTRDALNSL